MEGFFWAKKEGYIPHKLEEDFFIHWRFMKWQKVVFTFKKMIFYLENIEEDSSYPMYISLQILIFKNWRIITKHLYLGQLSIILSLYMLFTKTQGFTKNESTTKSVPDPFFKAIGSLCEMTRTLKGSLEKTFPIQSFIQCFLLTSGNSLLRKTFYLNQEG